MKCSNDLQGVEQPKLRKEIKKMYILFFFF
jgi:hypothetical protein